MSLALVVAKMGEKLSEHIGVVKGQFSKWQLKVDGFGIKVDNKIKDLTNWQNANDVEKIHKFEIDLSEFDANTMYPVYFRFGNGAANQNPLAEVSIGRHYYWNSRSPSPFNDNSSIAHVAGLDFKVIGSDYPWGGAGFHGVKVAMYEASYMHTMQLFDSHQFPVYIQDKGATSFTSDNSKKPTGSCPVFSGFYVRGGLLYKGFTKGMDVQPTLVTTPFRLYDNAPNNRSEWLAPFPYDNTNNSEEINNLTGGQ